jgi:mRNA interferase MazF
MAGFIKGDVVVIPFPFSDLSGSKRRPALVLATLPGNDIILCQITSQNRKDKFTTALSSYNFITGGLPVDSYVRPNRIFSADKNMIVRKAGTIKKDVMKAITETVIDILNS